MDPLKFVVLDEEDLEIASAHLQDAVVRASDILWRPQQKRVIVALNRFDWEAAANGEKPEFRRHRTALRFERVLACKCRHLDPATREDTVLNLLAVEFEETEAPSGAVILSFSGGATLRLEVECLEAELADLGPSWTTTLCPDHAGAETAADEA